MIKRIINFYGWNLTKNYKNRSYINQKPNLKLLRSLHAAKGILHMGGHRGSEAAIYNWLHKKTLWIEANPRIFVDLKNHISTYINQKAFNELIYHIDGEKLNPLPFPLPPEPLLEDFFPPRIEENFFTNSSKSGASLLPPHGSLSLLSQFTVNYLILNILL